MMSHKPTIGIRTIVKSHLIRFNLILFQFRHKGVPLVRASGPLVPGRRNNDDEKAVAAVLGGRKRGFILDVQVMNSRVIWSNDDAVDRFSFRQSNKEKEDRETWKQVIPGCS